MSRRFLILLAAAALLVALLPASPASAAHEDTRFGGIVTGAGPGGGPHVKVFDASGTLGASFFAYPSGFRGGVYVGKADIDGDNANSDDFRTDNSEISVDDSIDCEDSNDDMNSEADEIVTGAGAGGGPHVRVFNIDTSTITPVASFFAYAPGFRGGVRVAGGDVDKADPVADGATETEAACEEEIITGAGPGGGPHVIVWDVVEGGGATPQSSWLAFDAAYRGGVFVGFTDSDLSHASEDEGIVLVTADAGDFGLLRGFDHTGRLLFSQFVPNGGDGVKVAGRHEGGRPHMKVATGPGSGNDPVLTTYSWAGGPKASMLAYNPNFQGGINVGMIGGPGGGIVITAPGAGGGPHVRTFSLNEGELFPLDQFMAYDPGFQGGVNVAGGEFLTDPGHHN